MGNEPNTKCTNVTCSSCGYVNVFHQPYPYHAGFSDQGFLYNEAGNLTLTWSCYDPTYELVVGKNNPWTLDADQQQKLEGALDPAPFGGRW